MGSATEGRKKKGGREAGREGERKEGGRKGGRKGEGGREGPLGCEGHKATYGVLHVDQRLVDVARYQHLPSPRDGHVIAMTAT